MHHHEIPILPLTEQETAYLEEVARSRSESVLRARRAAMLLKYSNGIPISAIARTFRCSAISAEQGIDKAIQQEVVAARKKAGKGRDLRGITATMMDWVHDLACKSPRAFGYACATWPPSLLAQHVRDHCGAAGHHALAGLSCAELEGLMARDGRRSKRTRRLSATGSSGAR